MILQVETVDETVDAVMFDFPNVVRVLGLPTGVVLSVTKRFSNKLWLEQPRAVVQRSGVGLRNGGKVGECCHRIKY